MHNIRRILAPVIQFSQVVFRDIEDYKKFKQDPWYKEHLYDAHKTFADTKRSM